MLFLYLTVCFFLTTQPHNPQLSGAFLSSMKSFTVGYGMNKHSEHFWRPQIFCLPLTNTYQYLGFLCAFCMSVPKAPSLPIIQSFKVNCVFKYRGLASFAFGLFWGCAKLVNHQSWGTHNNEKVIIDSGPCNEVNHSFHFYLSVYVSDALFPYGNLPQGDDGRVIFKFSYSGTPSLHILTLISPLFLFNTLQLCW